VVHRSEQRQRDGVVTAEAHETLTTRNQRRSSLLDLADCLHDVKGIRDQITGVHDLLGAERIGIERWIVGP